MNAKDKQKLQRLFDKAVRGLKSQGFKRSFDEKRHACMYRGPNGMRCAVGWIIPNTKYTPSIEEQQVDQLVVRHFIGSCSDDVISGLLDMQHAHDDADTPADMRARLRDVANGLGLKATAIGRAK